MLQARLASLRSLRLCVKRFPFAACSPFSLKRCLTSSKCSTYGHKVLRRNIFTHLKQVVTVRQFAAKLLSGKTLTSRKSTLGWGCRSSIANYIVAKPTEFS